MTQVSPGEPQDLPDRQRSDRTVNTTIAGLVFVNDERYTG